MKVFVSFFTGMIVCTLMFFGMKTVLPIYAETIPDSGDNVTGLTDMLPDIEKIYHESLTLPFQKAEAKIYDDDIREYYHDLMNATGLGSYPDN